MVMVEYKEDGKKIVAVASVAPMKKKSGGY
jgi:hypothetical protein